MREISIIFSKYTTFNWFSSLIMYGINKPFSHAAVKMVDGDTGQVVYYQASGLKVNCVSEEIFLSKETIIYKKDVSVSDKVYKAGKSFAIAQLGKPYSIRTILGMAVCIMLSKVGINIKNPFKADGSQFVCSQFAAAYIEACENIDLDLSDMTPKALFDIMPTLPDVWE